MARTQRKTSSDKIILPFNPLPQASAEPMAASVKPEYFSLSSQVRKIIDDWHAGRLIMPAWFANNNINWVINGHISEHEFLAAFNYQVQLGIIYYVTQPVTPTPQPVTPTPQPVTPTPQPVTITPEPVTITPEPVTIRPDFTITDNMITQRLVNFGIINNRAVGQIVFTATEQFNPYYFNKTITNIIQFKTPNGVNILPFVKQNNLRFTATERTETINYDEGMKDNTRANVESFVWSDVTQPTPFSKSLKFEIETAPDNGQPPPVPKVKTTGFMGAGVAVSAIAFSIVLGYIITGMRKRKT